MEAGACDINRIDPNYGGFTGPMIAAMECEKAGIPLELHFHTPYEYNLQVIGVASRDTIRYVEVFDKRPANAHDRDAADVACPATGPVNAMTVACIGPDGMMSMPETPGLGVEFVGGSQCAIPR